MFIHQGFCFFAMLFIEGLSIVSRLLLTILIRFFKQSLKSVFSLLVTFRKLLIKWLRSIITIWEEKMMLIQMVCFLFCFLFLHAMFVISTNDSYLDFWHNNIYFPSQRHIPLSRSPFLRLTKSRFLRVSIVWRFVFL